MSLLVEAVAWVAGVLLLWRIPRCQAAKPPPDEGTGGGDVAVVIPARDEQAVLPRLLASLRAQQPPPAEVVVADDASGDATTAVARAGGATVVACGVLPDGWVGKAWACWTGARATTSPVLVFLDADCELEPGGLARLVDEHRRRGGLVSVQPDHRTERPHEALSAYFNVVSMMGVGAFTVLGQRLRPTGAFGPCLLSARASYLAVGGHRAVRGAVVDDVALAARFTEAGLPVTCLGGRDTIRFRMYPGGAAQLAEGWTKNMATGAASSRPAVLVLAVAWVGGCIGAATAGLGAGAGPAAPAVYAAYAAQLAWMLARIGRFPWWTAPLFPLPLAAFLALFACSLVRTHAWGRVTWRGRKVRVGRR